MIRSKQKSLFLHISAILIFVVVQLTAGAPMVSGQTFSCPKDPDYPPAGNTQLASGLRNECPSQGYYIFSGSEATPNIEYHAKSDSGTDTIIATLMLQDVNADPLTWRGTANYDRHVIEITAPRNGFSATATGSQAIRTDNPGSPNEASTGIRIAANDTFKAFAESRGITLESGSANFEADCKPQQGQKLDKSNCGIIAYIVDITKVLSSLVGIVVVIVIAIGGIQYAAARDDPSQVTAAKTRIRNAIFALVFYMFALAFLQWLVPGGIF